MSHVVVIGAGLSGLSAAAHLVAQGRRVTVLEAGDQPGGRAGSLSASGFTFDTGPTVLTMVDLLEEAFSAVGAGARERLALQRLDPAYRAVFADGSTLAVRAGHEAMRQEIADQCGLADAAAFDDFVTWLRRLYEIELSGFIDRNYRSPLSLLADPAAAAQLARLGGFGSLGGAIRRRFADERLQRIFSFQSMYAGLAPDQALAIYAVITYMDTIEGVWFPAGGMRRVGRALADAVADAGATVRYSTPVARILRRPDGSVCGVRLSDGEQMAADAVVCTVDLPIAYERLLPDVRPPAILRRPAYSPSCVVWHVGAMGTPGPEVAHHNIHFGQAWAQSFDDLLKRGSLMRDASRFVCVPSLHDASAAPEGASALYVLEPVPNLKVGRIDWAKERPAMRDRLAGFLSQAGYPSDVLTEELVTPIEWKAQGMAAGTPFALAHTFAQTGPFRPGNVRRDVPGLVFAGSGTVPGVGIPMVLISGKLAARRVAEVLR